MTGGGSRNGEMGGKLGSDRTAERTPKDTFTTSETRDDRKMSNTQKIQNNIVKRCLFH